MDEVHTLVILVIALVGAFASFAVLMWKIGGWQATQVEQLKGVHDRLDHMNNSIGEAHTRIDSHLESHTEVS